MLEDIFVAVAILTDRRRPRPARHDRPRRRAGRATPPTSLARGTVADFTRAMQRARPRRPRRRARRGSPMPVLVRSHDEMRPHGRRLQRAAAPRSREAARALDDAREGLRATARQARAQRGPAGRRRAASGAARSRAARSRTSSTRSPTRPRRARRESARVRARADGTAARAGEPPACRADRHARLSSVRLRALDTARPARRRGLAGRRSASHPELSRQRRHAQRRRRRGAGRAGPFGLLTAQSRPLRTFTPEELDFLQAIANVLADAIERDAGRASACATAPCTTR